MSEHNSAPTQNLDTKEHATHSIYMSSDAFNLLRKELYENWRDDIINYKTGQHEPGYWYYSGLMVANPQAFVEIMALELDLLILFDSGKESEICGKILNALRKKRGVNPLALEN